MNFNIFEIFSRLRNTTNRDISNAYFFKGIMQIFFKKILKKYPPQDCVEFFCDSNGGLRLVFGRQTQREIKFEVWKSPKIQTLIYFLKMLITERPIHFNKFVILKWVEKLKYNTLNIFIWAKMNRALIYEHFQKIN